MGNLTKASLDKLTKAALVDEVLKAQDEIENLSAEPMTSAKLLKTKLALVGNGQSTEVEIEKIKADRDAKIERINKEAELQMTSSLTEVIDKYNAIKDDVLNVDNALKSEIASAEVEANETIAEYQTKADEAKSKAESVIQEQLAAIDKSTEEYRENAEQLRKEHQRTIEDLDFDHKQALKQKNESFADKLAKELGMSLVDTDELKDLRSVEVLSEDKIQGRIDEAVSAAISKTESKNGAILNRTKHEAELDKIKLQTNVDSLTTQLENANARITAFEKQVAEFPATLNAALVAAKADVKVTNEGVKK